MAPSLLSLLGDLQERIAALQDEIRNLQIRNEELEQEIADVRAAAKTAIESRDKALLDVEYLRVSHLLAKSPDSLAETRRKIAGLIRNIDRCIQMLKE